MRPLSSMASAAISSISPPAFTSTVPVMGSITSSTTTRPSKRSPSGSMISSPSFSGPTSMPFTVPQSSMFTMTSCATSTRRRVR
jgi:hypothetical protein